MKRITEDGYDDPTKQENQWIKCYQWTKGVWNLNSVCISSVCFAAIAVAVLVSLAAWSYISTLTSLDHTHKGSKLFENKNDVGSYYKKNEIVDYISDIKNDNLFGSSDPITSDPMILPPGAVPPDIPDIPLMGSSAAVPDTPFPSGSETAADKPYVIPAQPNDLNLDLIDDTPRGGITGNDVVSLGKPTDGNSPVDTPLSDRILHKVEKINPGKLTKFTKDDSVNRHNVHNILDGEGEPEKPRPAAIPVLSPQMNKVMLPLVDPDPPSNSNKIPDVSVIIPTIITPLDGNVNKQHEIRKIESPLATTDTPELIPMTLYRIHSAIKSGAVCLDGSVPAYYHRPGIGTSERLWIIHFNGGAWCFDAKACFERSHSSLGSTNKLPAAPPIIQGINSPDPIVNPDFHDWNLVWVVYCDGASFTGDQDRPLISESGDTIYLRGKRVLNAIINDVLKNRNLKDAEALILTGSSAGSMTAIFQADYIASKLPKTIPVRVFSDAGFFIDTSSIGGKNLNEVFRNIYEMQNSSAGLNQDCVRDVGKKNGWQCFYPAKAVSYVKTPIFVLNSLYDIWALMYFIGINCKFPIVRQQERKKRSLYKDYLFPKDSELEVPEEAILVEDEQFRNNRKRRDVSGFEIFPFFRTPMYLAPEQSVEKKLEKTAEKRTDIKLNNRHKKVAAGITVVHKNINRKDKKSNIPSPEDIEIHDVLLNLSNETIPLPVNHPQLYEIRDMLKQLKSHTSKEQFSYLTHNMAASFQRSIGDKKVYRKSSITKPNEVKFKHNNNTHSTSVNATALNDQGDDGMQLEKHLEGEINETNRNIIQSIRLKLLDFITHHHVHNHTGDGQVSGVARDEIKHPLKRNKTRRSTSIAKEYINILRSDPPECTEKELLTAMLYRNLIIRATNNLIHNPKSARFLISCINHSSSLFDDTWTTLKVGGKTIQQAFGDWFFERDDKGNYDLVDCPYPCNPTCP